MKVKTLPNGAEFQRTLSDGSKLYAAARRAYIVKQTNDGEVIDSIHINR